MNGDAQGGNPKVGTAPLAFRVPLRAILSVVSVCLLLALAAAVPPDPLWIGGIYDGGDSDDLVALSADADLLPSPIAAPAREGRGLLFPAAEPDGTPVVTVRPLWPRAPPFA